jgi:hypothetical protein
MKSPLQLLPGVGPSIARDLADLGYREPSDLKGEDPEEMFRRLVRKRGERIDRCVLYTFRCAVHCAAHGPDDPVLSKWWNWKDRTEG